MPRIEVEITNKKILTLSQDIIKTTFTSEQWEEYILKHMRAYRAKYVDECEMGSISKLARNILSLPKRKLKE